MQVHVIPNYSRCIIEIQNNEVNGFFPGPKIFLGPKMISAMQ